MITNHDIESTHWDALVVGSGMGGATAGYALAQAGMRVLFCEKGRLAPSLLGCYPEERLRSPYPRSTDRELLAASGRCWEEIDDLSEARPKSFVPFIGCGAGGSSALYGMVLERFRREDFVPRQNHPGFPGAELPESWPFSYEELAPYYQEAETLYRVRGGVDPLRGEMLTHLHAPPPLQGGQRVLFERLSSEGLHPYQLPLANENVPGCEVCQGVLCARSCKNDSRRICLEPAIKSYGARFVDECEVIHLETDGRRVVGVHCVRNGKPMTLRAGRVILAAGALHTPAILLRSTSDAWPSGLGNSSGLVGRNLMRHYVDLYVLAVAPDGHRQDKAIGFNDLLESGDTRLGGLQSFGSLPPASMLVESLQEDLRHARGGSLAALFGMVKPVVKTGLHLLLTRRLALASLMEDMPSRDNRVEARNGRTLIHYRIQDYDRRRIDMLRALLQRRLKALRPMVIKQAESNERLAHVCGTCRAGKDPTKSVVDADCRSHDVRNLYVADASFLPSSGGTNPALTVAANALRVARRMLDFDDWR